MLVEAQLKGILYMREVKNEKAWKEERFS